MQSNRANYASIYSQYETEIAKNNALKGIQNDQLYERFYDDLNVRVVTDVEFGKRIFGDNIYENNLAKDEQLKITLNEIMCENLSIQDERLLSTFSLSHQLDKDYELACKLAEED